MNEMKWKIVSVSGYSYFCDIIVLVDRETGSPGVLRARSPMVCESYDPEVLPGVAEGKEKWGSNTAMTAYNGVWAETQRGYRRQSFRCRSGANCSEAEELLTSKH